MTKRMKCDTVDVKQSAVYDATSMSNDIRASRRSNSAHYTSCDQLQLTLVPEFNLKLTVVVYQSVLLFVSIPFFVFDLGEARSINVSWISSGAR